MKRALIVWLLVIAGTVFGAACGDSVSNAGGLPTLPPTVTAVQPVTPTPVPAAAPVALPAVDWDDVDRFRAAMRDEFAGDIDRFADRDRYYIEATLTIDQGTALVRGAARVRYTNHSADTLTEIVFRLYPNTSALGGRMTVYRVEVNGERAETRLAERETALIIPLADPLKTGDSAEMALEFSTAAERGLYANGGKFGYQDDIFSGPEWFPMLSVYEEGRGWWMARPLPGGDETYSSSALYEVFFTTPENFIVAASGTRLDEFPAGDGQTTHHFVTGPMRDMTIVAGPLFGVLTGTVDDIAIKVHYWPGDEPAAEEVMEIAQGALTAFNATFGPYPFAELDIMETFMASAMEYPGLILVNNDNWERGNPFMENATAHEIGHQWFYSVIGSNQISHPWIDESLTSFTEYVYYRHFRGEDRFKEVLQGDRDNYNFYKGTGAPDLALNLPVTSYVDNNYGMIIYVKGPLFYIELENILGREKFQEGLQLYFQRHRYELVRSEDVLAAFEDATGDDLDTLFYAWVGDFAGLDPDAKAEVDARRQ